jgi:hypothetical protein
MATRTIHYTFRPDEIRDALRAYRIAKRRGFSGSNAAADSLLAATGATPAASARNEHYAGVILYAAAHTAAYAVANRLEEVRSGRDPLVSRALEVAA